MRSAPEHQNALSMYVSVRRAGTIVTAVSPHAHVYTSLMWKSGILQCAMSVDCTTSCIPATTPTNHVIAASAIVASFMIWMRRPMNPSTCRISPTVLATLSADPSRLRSCASSDVGRHCPTSEPVASLIRWSPIVTLSPSASVNTMSELVSHTTTFWITIATYNGASAI